jgi:hypothetical protein
MATTMDRRNTLSQRWSCPPGYGGLSCEEPMSTACFIRFDTKFYCQAESPCAKNTSGTGFCDCSQANPKSAFAGLDCDYSATEYCTDDASILLIACCTNGGNCVSYIDDDDSTSTIQRPRIHPLASQFPWHYNPPRFHST